MSCWKFFCAHCKRSFRHQTNLNKHEATCAGLNKNECNNCPNECTWVNQQGNKFCETAAAAASANREATVAPTPTPIQCGPCSQLDIDICYECGCRIHNNMCKNVQGNIRRGLDES